MAKERHLNNAPIIEALIDIRVKLPPHIDVVTLRKIHSSISKEYPEEKEIIRGRITFKAAKATAEDAIQHECAYISANEKQIAQARLDGFTFSRLRPYETWKSLRSEAYRLWRLYAEVSSPESITRVALRYINRLEIPIPFKDFNEYITAPPSIPPNLPQEGLSSFLTRIVIPVPAFKAVAIITQALEPRTSEKIASVILYIDVFKEQQFDSDGKEAWEVIDKLHTLKNNIFFESITEEMASLCE